MSEVIHVFIGPTLDPGEPVLAAPGIRVRPPVQHGDLFDAAIRDGDTVVVIDGVYHQAPAVRHKEILVLLARGVRVIGAGSIGALRAAELHPFGMVGVGSVFDAYVRGILDGDDEVAVGQEPGEGQRALTWPLVNLRKVLRLAETEGIVTSAAAAQLLEALRAVYYPQRTTAAVMALARRCQAHGFAPWLQQQRAADPHFGDVKRLDALQALHLARTGRRVRPMRAADGQWDTGYYRRWANHFAVQEIDGVVYATSDRLSYQALFDPSFPAVWARQLEYLSQRPDDGSPPLPLTERAARAGCGHLPASLLFRPPVDLHDPATVARLLANETAGDRAAICRYQALVEEAGRTVAGFVPEALDDDTARRTLLALWHTRPGDLERCAAARGFRSSTHALEELKPFLLGLLHDQNPTRPNELTADDH